MGISWSIVGNKKEAIKLKKKKKLKSWKLRREISKQHTRI